MKRGILILGLFLVSVLAVFNVVAPEYVNMGFDNINYGTQTLDVVVNTSLNVYGFQFALNGVQIIDDSVTAGDMIADWSFLDNHGNNVGAFDQSQNYFSESGTLLSLGFSNYTWDAGSIGPICFDLGSDINGDGWEDYNIISNMFGEPLCACWSDECVGNYCECSCNSAPGDINNDLSVNVADVVQLVTCILGDDCNEQEYGCAGLLSNDGGWNVQDIVILVTCILVENCDELGSG